MIISKQQNKMKKKCDKKKRTLKNALGWYTACALSLTSCEADANVHIISQKPNKIRKNSKYK